MAMDTVGTVRKHARALVRHFGFFRNYFSDTNATYSETHALLELERFNALEVGELGRIINVDKTLSSKILASMKKKGWVKVKKAPDARKKLFALTAGGKKMAGKIEDLSNETMGLALDELDGEQRDKVLQGLGLLSYALKRSAARKEYTIRLCEPEDDRHISSIVKRSLKDLGFAGPGTAAADPTIDYLSSFNDRDRQCYFVAEKDGKIMGGAGILPMDGEGEDVCELVRMFLHPEARGSGLSQLLMEKALAFAEDAGYKLCYLETTEEMKAAQNLYLRYGFRYVKKRRGNTGHFACNVLMEKELES